MCNNGVNINILPIYKFSMNYLYYFYICSPSGAGKTTIISLVTGKAKKTEGRVLLNGTEVEGLMHIRKVVGFVPQEDVMIRELTVRDIIEFSARYRLPASTTESEIHDKVSACIEELGISHVQFSVIGY